MVRLLDRRRSPDQSAAASPDQQQSLLPGDLMIALQQLRIAVPRVQRGSFAGEHRSRRRGASPEFADFKRYSPGDDIRRVDWNLYARLDTLFVRESEATTDLTVHIVLDSSPSMDFASESGLPTKSWYAKQMAAVIGYVTLWHFDRMRVAPFTTAMGQPLGPLTGRARITPMLDYFARPDTGESTSVAQILHRFGHQVTVPGLLIVLSDLLSDDPEPLGEQVRTLLSRGWEVLIIQVLDPAEVAPERLVTHTSRNQPITLTDSEHGDQVLLVLNEETCETYRAAYEPWQAEMEAAIKRAGINLITLATDQPLGTTALHLLHRVGILA